MSNVIEFRKNKPIDPIIRRGDFVRLVDIDSIVEGYDDESIEWMSENLYDVVAIVVGVKSVYPPDHPASGQAVLIDIAIPIDEEEWMPLDEVSTQHVNRVIGLEADRRTSYRQEYV